MRDTRFMVKAKEIREKSPEEIKRLLAEWREELFKLSIQSMTGHVEKSSRARGLRKNIARVLTVLAEQHGKDEGVTRESKAL